MDTGLLETILLEWSHRATGVVLLEGIVTGATYITQLLRFLETIQRHQKVLKEFSTDVKVVMLSASNQ